MVPDRLEWMTSPYYSYSFFFPCVVIPQKLVEIPLIPDLTTFQYFLEISISSERLFPTSDGISSLMGAKSRKQLCLVKGTVCEPFPSDRVWKAHNSGSGWMQGLCWRWMMLAWVSIWTLAALTETLQKWAPSLSGHPRNLCALLLCQARVDARWEDWQDTGASFCVFSSLSVPYFPFGCPESTGFWLLMEECFWKWEVMLVFFGFLVTEHEDLLPSLSDTHNRVYFPPVSLLPVCYSEAEDEEVPLMRPVSFAAE